MRQLSSVPTYFSGLGVFYADGTPTGVLKESAQGLVRRLVPGRTPEELAHVAVFLSDLGEVVTPRTKIKVLDDEPDNRILECAVAGSVDVIVTGDQAMLDLGSYAGIRMMTLREFLKSS